MNLDHQGDALRLRHFVRVYREGRLGGRLGHDLADGVEDVLNHVDLEVHRVREEVLQLLQDPVDGHVGWRWILHNLVDFLKTVGLIEGNILPVLTKGLQRHLDFLDEAVDEDWDPDVLVKCVAQVRDLQVDVELRNLAEGLLHHGHNDCLWC